jgi:hypothetical protein
LAGSSGARGALRKALTDPRVAALARSLRVDLSDESAWEEVINRAAHALEPNAHGTECHPQKMKHAKSCLFARPPSPLAGGYQSARCARQSQGAPNKVFHVNGTSDAGGWEGATFTPLASLSILRKRGTGRLPHHCLVLKTMPLHANATPLRQFGLQVAFQLVKGDGLAID